jgi:hypothetical protein
MTNLNFTGVCAAGSCRIFLNGREWLVTADSTPSDPVVAEIAAVVQAQPVGEVAGTVTITAEV